MVQKNFTVFYRQTTFRSTIYQVLVDCIYSFTHYHYDRHKYEYIIDNEDIRLFDDKETHFCVQFKKGLINGVLTYSVVVWYSYEITELLDTLNQSSNIIVM